MWSDYNNMMMASWALLWVARGSNELLHVSVRAEPGGSRRARSRLVQLHHLVSTHGVWAGRHADRRNTLTPQGVVGEHVAGAPA